MTTSFQTVGLELRRLADKLTQEVEQWQPIDYTGPLPERINYGSMIDVQRYQFLEQQIEIPGGRLVWQALSGGALVESDPTMRQKLILVYKDAMHRLPSDALVARRLFTFACRYWWLYRCLQPWYRWGDVVFRACTYHRFLYDMAELLPENNQMKSHCG